MARFVPTKDGGHWLPEPDRLTSLMIEAVALLEDVLYPLEEHLLEEAGWVKTFLDKLQIQKLRGVE